MELKKMTDQELALRIIEYVQRLEKLMYDAEAILQVRGRASKYQIDYIHDEYRNLKQEINADAHYVSLMRNEKQGFNLYNSFFVPSIREASASGFKSSVNSRIDQAFFSSLEEAHYKLTKYHGLKEWQEIANQR